MVTLPDGTDVQPDIFVTLKVYIPGFNNDIVELDPEPLTEISPGDLVKVHDPVDGKPPIITLPVALEHVVWVIVPTVGAEGPGEGIITISTVADEVHPAELETAYVYVPDARPEIDVLVPEPLEFTAPGNLVRVHVPVAGNPLKFTLPVGTEHVGSVIVPIIGAAGVVLTVTADTFE